MKIPAGYCATCNRNALGQVDLEDEARNLVRKLKGAIPLAGAIGGRDAALAEVCWLLDLPVPADMQRQSLTEQSARVLLAEIMRRFGDMLVDMLSGSRLMEEYEYLRNENRRREEMMKRRWEDQRVYSQPRQLSGGHLPVDFKAPQAEKFYYVPEYRVKENKR